MDIKNKRVLITGGAGFLGGAICRQLVAAGWQVMATRHRAIPHGMHGVQWVTADLTHRSDLPRVDAVVHAAALLPSTFEQSAAMAAKNQKIDSTIFDYVRREKISLVYLSGTSIYGLRREGGFCDESAAVHPHGEYMQEKGWAEQECARLDAPCAVLRISAPYGPGQLRKTVMNLFIERALEGRSLEYHGTGDREQDFTYVDDVVHAVERALLSNGGVYNIAGGKPVTMKALACLIAQCAGAGEELVRSSGRSDEQEGVRARFDISKAARELGWVPQWALADGILRCINARKRTS